MLNRHVIDIDDTREPSTLNPTMRLYSAEDVPAVVTVALIARETEGDEERFYGFGAVANPYQFPVSLRLGSGCEKGEEGGRHTEGCIERRMVRELLV